VDQTSVIPESVTSALNEGKSEDPNYWLGLFDGSDWRVKAFLILAAGLFVLWVFKRLRRAVRRMRPPRLHPKLQKYGANYGKPSPELLAKRRAEAGKVVATSSTSTIAGYTITEQIETVFVDGFRRPEEALEGLKAAAAMKGANAVTNVRHERTAADKLSAMGDAVIVRRVTPAQPPAAGPDATSETDHAAPPQSFPPPESAESMPAPEPNDASGS